MVEDSASQLFPASCRADEAGDPVMVEVESTERLLATGLICQPEDMAEGEDKSILDPHPRHGSPKEEPDKSKLSSR